MEPDSKKYNPSPNYLRGLIQEIGLSQMKIARALGIDDRTFRRYIADVNKKSYAPIPYPTQFTLEVWASNNNQR